MFELNLQPADRQLRHFAVLWVLFFLALTVRWCWPTGPVYAAAGVSSLVMLVGLIGWFRPLVIRPLYLTWMIGVYPIAWTVSRFVLALLFYGLFAPIGLVFRLLGRDGLGLTLDPKAETYWVSKGTSGDPRRYLEQY